MSRTEGNVMWEVIKIVIVGIVQGLTEFLPVSSSGHIAIFKEIFGLSENGVAFDVLLHFGTLIAVCVFYYKDIIALVFEAIELVKDIFKRNKIYNKERPYRVLLLMLIITTIPTAIAGLLLEDLFETVFTSLLVIGIALLITSALMYIISNIKVGTKQAKDITVKDALVVGLCQSCAITPGISRSGATIFAGRISGFDTQLAVKYSFLCSLPAVLGSVVLKIGDLFEQSLSNTQVTGYIIAFIASGIVGFLSLNMLNMMAKKRNMKPFSIYCACAGLFCIVYSIVKAISA